jgi:hypothetical protein
MSILTLLITFLGSLFKSHRQLPLENLALRQQVTMLRQQVRRPRATAADKLFCSKRDVNKRKHHTTRHTRRPVANPCTPNPFTSSCYLEYVKFVRYNWSFLPRYTPYFFPPPTIYLAGEFLGFAYSARSGQLPSAVPAISYPYHSGNLWCTLPKGITLPMPWPICSPALSGTILESVPPAGPRWINGCERAALNDCK